MVDTTAPRCTNLPTEISRDAELGTTGVIVEPLPEPTCADNSGTGAIAERTHMPGDFFPVGETLVTYTCSDASNNTAVCTLTVLVVSIDTTAPRCTNLPTKISRGAELGTTGVIVEPLPEPTCVDNSGTGAIAERTHMPGDFFPVGETLVTYTCSDASNNTAVCTLTVLVVSSDNDLPELGPCPDDVQVFSDDDQVVLVYTTPNCTGIDMDAGSVTCEPPAGVPLDHPPRHITCTCTGAADVEATMECLLPTVPDPLMCPESMSVSPNQEVTSVEVEYLTPNCTNYEGLVFDAICLPAPGDTFTLGVTKVGCVCSYTGQRLDECSFTITVLDPSSNQLTTWILLSAAATLLILFIGIAVAVYCVKCRRKKTERPPPDIPMSNRSTASPRPATLAYDEPDDGHANQGLDQDQVPRYAKNIHPIEQNHQGNNSGLRPNTESTYYTVVDNQ